MDAVERARRLLSEVREDEAFRLADGRLIRSLRELAVLLDTLDEAIFTHHVNEVKNDFAVWIEQCIGDSELATRLRLSPDYTHFREAIRERIAELEADVLAREAPVDTPSKTTTQKDVSQDTVEDSSGGSSEKEALTHHSVKDDLAEVESLLEQELRELEEQITQDSDHITHDHLSEDQKTSHDSNGHTLPRASALSSQPHTPSEGRAHTQAHTHLREEDSMEHVSHSFDGRVPPSHFLSHQPVPTAQENTAVDPEKTLLPESIPSYERSFYWTDFIIGLAAGVLIGVLTTILYTILTSGGV